LWYLSSSPRFSQVYYLESVFRNCDKYSSHRFEELGDMIRSARGVEMIFGSPEKDPNGIAREEGWDLDPPCSTPHIEHALRS